MASNADFFPDARDRMVDSQIRPNKVSDPRILTAMRTLPRERFLPASVQALAYADEDVPLPKGRALMEPMVFARLLQAAAPVPGETALIVGAGTGYGATVLAECGVRVTALEDDQDLYSRAHDILMELAPSVTLVSGPLSAGWAASAPYDLIVIEGAVHTIPASLVQQLRIEGGRLVGVLAGPDRVRQAVLGEATAAGLRTSAIFDCGTPLLPSLVPAPEFVF
jgi:protein-L-isoaspartate(D-aspartate) O-methyltransferase